MRTGDRKTVAYYCINPKCQQRQNRETAETCAGCGAALWVGDRYRLVRPLRSLQEPGNAEIFEIEDLLCQPPNQESPAAPNRKVLKVSKKNNSVAVGLLQQEAEVLKTLSHPGLPHIQPGDGYFVFSLPQRKKPLHCLVMEKVPGENLKTLVEREGSISPEQAWSWLLQLLDILNHLHQHRYLHRDIKPSNIMLRPDGQLVLIDFGAVHEVSYTVIERLMGKDVTGLGIFSPGYTAPEQVTGRTVPQSDLYALGRTLVFLLTQAHPLDLEVSEKNGGLLWRLLAPQVPKPLADWLDYLMEPLFWQRPPNAAFVLEQLKGGLVAPPVKRSPAPSPLWIKLLNLGLFTVLLVTTLFWWQGHREAQQHSVPEGIIQLN
ncbi:serine/threonine-protein kinase [Sphaerothrix gracilis]|uniref:serine/threonine protein kinase n=1 Tax=Sphaerothrix gracilis TaxID=3151835 RepID=UPI0031FD90E7